MGNSAGNISADSNVLVAPSDADSHPPAIPFVPVKRGRGRSVETGIGRVIARERAVRARETELRAERELLDSSQRPENTKSYRNIQDVIRTRIDEFRQAPLVDLEALAAERATQIYKVVTRSQNMKGTLICAAKEAAADMCAAATALAIAAQNPRDRPVDEQLMEIRCQMGEFRKENEMLREQVAQLLGKLKKKGKGRLPSTLTPHEIGEPSPNRHASLRSDMTTHQDETGNSAEMDFIETEEISSSRLLHPPT